MHKLGKLEVVAGCMFAGKTEELIRKAHTLQRAKKKYLVFKPSIDDRFGSDEVKSHSGSKVDAIEVDKPRDIIQYIDKQTKMILVDEAQFFEESLVEVVSYLLDIGIDVLCVGLDMDFRGVPFPTMSLLFAKANQVSKITSYCAVCGDDATRTQRMIGSNPASYDDPIVLIGASDSYEPRCHLHHIVLNKPEYFKED